MSCVLDKLPAPCKTIYMPVKKKPAGKTHTAFKGVSEQALSKAYESEFSYETRVIIVVLLLLFVYPIGLIFMWAWMRNWPLWVKLLITLPFILGIFAIFGLFMLIGSLVTQSNMHNRYPEYPTPMRQERQVTPSPKLPTAITPTTNTAI